MHIILCLIFQFLFFSEEINIPGNLSKEYGAGENVYGQLGSPTTLGQYRYEVVTLTDAAFNGANIISGRNFFAFLFILKNKLRQLNISIFSIKTVLAGGFHSVFISDRGIVFTCGWDTYGQVQIYFFKL